VGTLKAQLISGRQRALRCLGSEGSFTSTLSIGRMLLHTTSLKKLQVREDKERGMCVEREILPVKHGLLF